MKKMPVLVTFFNRPEVLEHLFQVLVLREDIEIFFACDGPRHEKDKIDIDQCWILVDKYFKHVPIGRRLERNQNLGCKIAMRENIDWFFSNNKYGLILEDDCIPNDDFFRVLGKGLIDFNDSRKFMSISGSDYYPKENRVITTFRESLFPQVWGWGTWAAKWECYRLDIPDYEEIVTSIADRLYGSRYSIKKVYFKNVFEMRFNEVNQGRINTWDYSLTASTWREGFSALQVNSNLIVNSGFSKDATHTKFPAPSWVPKKYEKIESLDFAVGKYSKSKDIWLAENVFNCTLKESLKNEVKKIVRK
jgi:hypothetical protein